MANSTGPYPDEQGFERWQDQSPIFRRRFSEVMSVIVNFLPGDINRSSAAWGDNAGWGYVVLVDGVVINGRYDVEWTAGDAMRAGVAKAETAPAEFIAEE